MDVKILSAWVEDARCHVHRDGLDVSIQDGYLSCTLTPPKPIALKSAHVLLSIALEGRRALANGFQSWSQSFIGDRNSRIPCLSPLLGNLLEMKWYGDYPFYCSPNKRGVIHSHEYLRIFEEDKEVLFLGSTRPEKAYTIFEIDFNKNTVECISDLEGLLLDADESLEMLRISIQSTAEAFFDIIGRPAEAIPNRYGWTSWYQYYTHIDESIILHNLNVLIDKNIPIDVFQIDDGWQEAIGDWLRVNDKFPKGMAKVAETISHNNITPGLWFSPFIAERKSELFQKYPEFLLSNCKNRLQKAGFNPNWSGKFFALNIYQSGVPEYLSEVFNTVIQQWGFQFIKLDFLYAAALCPMPNKTRASIMYDALKLINSLRGDAVMLGCGCPIGVAYGMCEYMRIGGDVALKWEDRLLAALNYRERVSTVSSLINTRNRAFLDGNAFRNDPDVFILRDTPDVKLTDAQKQILFETNMQHGGLVFFSGDVSVFDDAKLDMLRNAFSAKTEKKRA